MGKNIYLFVVIVVCMFFLNIVVPQPLDVSAITVNKSGQEIENGKIETTGENPPLGYEYMYGGDEIAVLGYRDPYGYKNAVKISEGSGSTYKNWETYSNKNYASIELCDLDGDAIDDLILLEADTTGIKIKVIGSTSSYTITKSGDYYPRDIACGDFNRDSQNEIAVLIGDWFDGKRLIIFDSGGNVIADNLKISGNLNDDSWKQIVCGDVDGDLVDEIVTLSEDLDDHSNLICVRHEVLIEEDDDPIADNYKRFRTDEKVINIACGDFKSDLDGKDEIILSGHKGSTFDDYKIIDENGNTIKGWSNFPGQSGGYVSAGDFDNDGDDEIVLVTQYASIKIFDAGDLDYDPFTSKSFDISSNYAVAAVSCGDVDADGIKLEYVMGSKTTFDSDEYYPVALLYHPPCLDGFNSGDYVRTYSAYGYKHTTINTDANVIGVKAETQLSCSPKLFGYFKINLKAKFKKYIEERAEYGTVKSTSTTYMTGTRKEPYLYLEKTIYDVYEYRIANGPNSGEIFTIDLPTEIITTSRSLSSYNSNRINAPEIISEHTTGDPTSYTVKNTDGFYDQIQTDWFRTAEGPHCEEITLGDYQSRSFSSSEEVCYTIGLRIFLGLDSTTSLKNGKSHVIAVGDSTTFGFKIDVLDQRHQEKWGYDYRMYLRRDTTYNYVIIDFLVNPDTMGNGYVDDNDPTCDIIQPKEGYLYLNGRELIPIIHSDSYDSIVIFPLDFKIEAFDSLSGIDKVNVIVDGDEYLAQQEYDGTWTFPVINNNPNSFEIHRYRAKAYDGAGHTVTTDEIKIKSLLAENNGGLPPFLYENINGPQSGKSGRTYSYSFQVFDMEGDDIYYRINWGDGDEGEWIGPIPTNSFSIDDNPMNYLIDIETEHEWTKSGSYNVTVEVKDSNNNEGLYPIQLDVEIKKKSRSISLFQYLRQILFDGGLLHFLKNLRKV